MLESEKGKIKKHLPMILLALTLFVILGWWSYSHHTDKGNIPVEGDKIKPSDYADKNNWLALPQHPEKETDVFYVYPTSWKSEDDEVPLSKIADKKMRAGAQKRLHTQASAFAGAGNLYAPYYRQLDAMFVLVKTPKEQERYFKGVPKTDVIAAFDFYIKNHNKGRPFILAGHSQGATMIKEILFDYLKQNPEVAKRMIAAYVIGYSVTKEELAANPHVKFAQGANDTGVIISYNTEAKVVDGKNNTVLEGSVAINPISWTRGETPASASKSLGSRMEVDGEFRKVMNFADAKVDTKRGTVICSSVNPDLYSISGVMEKYFPHGVYHSYDIAFYYYNLKQNAENRAAKYLEKHKE
ncbi:hypothetical protein Dip510_001300 [Elusimicrobium posterum]|uniref:DUF3089 domain-containing protein n=1 Tax=Elusimicrobium posterum TaxID=3116653 RepID=UPI003C7392DE